jgi:DNA polymerase-4
LTVPTNASNTIYTTACQLFDELWDGTPVRLLGIRTSKLTDETEPIQLSLTDIMPVQKNDEKNQKLDKALDTIRKKYGSSAIVRGSMLGTDYQLKK